MKKARLVRKTRKILKIGRGTLRKIQQKMSCGHLAVDYRERIEKLVKP